MSSEIFQKRLMQAIDGLPGTMAVADDVIIYGKSLADHDKNLEAFLERCKS